MIKIGLTGTIASGKSKVSELFRKEGIAVFDSDKYAKTIYEKDSPYLSNIIDLLGKDIIVDSRINYQKISQIIFNDEAKRLSLNNIIHPYVKEGIKEFFKIHKKDEIVCAEVPLLFEAKYEKLFDDIIVITCKKNIAIKRMMKDRGYSKEEAIKRYDSQINNNIQMLKADYVIYNDTTVNYLKSEVLSLLEDIKSEN